ncbi:MAG: SWIM zinc finger domain-containing protein [Halorubrum sp.]
MRRPRRVSSLDGRAVGHENERRTDGSGSDDTDGDPDTSDHPNDSGDLDDEDEPADRDETDGQDDRSVRARREQMTVYPLRDRRYLVETAGGSYVVALDAGACSCPDHEIRGSRCKHLRRVAMAVTAGEIPAPDERVGVCAVCGAETFVPFTADGPQLCTRHGFARGDAVRDRETGKLLVVTGVTDRRADEYRTDEARAIDEYPTNTAYGAHEPVVEAVYVESLTPTHGIEDARRYGFPASRLSRADDRLRATDRPAPNDQSNSET